MIRMPAAEMPPRPQLQHELVRQGILTEALTPNDRAFFLCIHSQFIVPRARHVFLHVIVLAQMSVWRHHRRSPGVLMAPLEVR